MNYEATIRDHLATMLEVLEPGLELLNTEEYLPNKDGAYGFVDLVARDRFRNIVLIELKRSDGAARQAIHELYKYIVLIRQNHKLPVTKIRCFVVSTTWHELLVPFSEFQRTSPFSVDGFRLTVDEDLKPLNAERVTPLDEEQIIRICPYHKILCCEHENDRVSASDAMVTKLLSSGYDNLVVFWLDYKGPPNMICFPYAVYLVLGELSEEQHIRATASQQLENDNALEESEDDWFLEQAIIGSVYKMINLQVGSYEWEIGYPEKLMTVLNTNWEIRKILRPGTLFKSTSIYPDQDVVAWCTGVEGSSWIKYSAMLSPRFEARWSNLSMELEHVLKGNLVWQAGILHYLDLVAQTYPEASVLIDIYNPMDSLAHMVQALAERDLRYVPNLQICVDDTENSGKYCVFIGKWHWTGNGLNGTAEQQIDAIFGSFSNYQLARHFHSVWEEEPKVLDSLCIEYALFEIRSRGVRANSKCRRLHVDQHGLKWSTYSESSLKENLNNYFSHNSEWLSDLVILFQKNFGSL